RRALLPRAHRTVSEPRRRARAGRAGQSLRLSRRHHRRVAPVTRRRLVLAAAILVVACGPGAIVRHGTINADLLSSVERTLERVRGLQFTAEVPARILDDAEVASFLDQELSREFAPGELEHLSAIYRRLGFLSAGVELKPAFQE